MYFYIMRWREIDQCYTMMTILMTIATNQLTDASNPHLLFFCISDVSWVLHVKRLATLLFRIVSVVFNNIISIIRAVANQRFCFWMFIEHLTELSTLNIHSFRSNDSLHIIISPMKLKIGLPHVSISVNTYYNDSILLVFLVIEKMYFYVLNTYICKSCSPFTILWFYSWP